MIRLHGIGPHLQLLSTLCSQCPQGPIGCCISPPPSDWTDLGRIVSLGGRDFLLAELAAGNLLVRDEGLQMKRARRRESLTEPRRNKCIYHGSTGCTISPDRRPATCNYFLCEDAYVDGGEARGEPEALAARRAHLALMERYRRWDQQIAEKIRALWPEGPPWDAAFFDWLGAEFARFDGGPALGYEGPPP